MKVYSPDDYAHVTPLGGPAAKGEEFDVDEDTARGLIEQGWTSARAKAAKRTGRRRRAAAKTDEPVLEGEQVDDSAGESTDPDASAVTPNEEN